MCSLLDTLHKLIVQSEDPDAKYSPSPENATLFTGKEWPLRVFISSPLDIHHNPIVQSEDPDAK